MAGPPGRFVPIETLKGRTSPESVVREIRDLYFKTTPRTIDEDFQAAVELVKSLPDETERQKATVYMQGLAEMRRDWSSRAPAGPNTRKKK
jgi:hypothetical protein